MNTHPLQVIHREGRLHSFGVRINAVYRRYYCTAHSDSMGFMYADGCPDCRLEPDGWEAWGDNGHMQGSGPDRASLLHWLRYQAYRAWSAERTFGPKHYLRMTFKRGGRIVYLG